MQLEAIKSGKTPYLAVLHQGEQVLSTLNGEAQKYQSMQALFGPNPLKLLNFAYGTPMSSESLLKNLAVPTDLNLNLDNGKGYITQTHNETNINLHNNYYAPTDRFNRQQATMARDQIDMLRRGVR
jgi:hypothetical protein